MYDLIKKWKVNQAMLAKKMGMSHGHFKNKLSPNNSTYNFTEKEIERLNTILKEMGHDLNKYGKESIDKRE